MTFETSEKAHEDVKVFLKKKKKKSNNMVVSNTEILQKMKNKNLLNIEKNISKLEGLIKIIRNFFFQKSNNLENSFDKE